MLMVVLSAVFSIDSVSSWLGGYGKFSDSAIGLLAMCLLYFVVVNNVRLRAMNPSAALQKGQPSAKKIQGQPSRVGVCLGTVIRLVLVSGWVAVLAAYFSVFNLWSKIPGLPSIMSLRSFNPVSSSFEGLSVFFGGDCRDDNGCVFAR